MISPSEGLAILKKWENQKSKLTVLSKESFIKDAPLDPLVRVELDGLSLRLVSLSGGSDRMLDLTDVEFSLTENPSRITLTVKFPDDGRSLLFEEALG